MPDYDALDFEARDEIDAERDTSAALALEEITGLAARPGVIR